MLDIIEIFFNLVDYEDNVLLYINEKIKGMEVFKVVILEGLGVDFCNFITDLPEVIEGLLLVKDANVMSTRNLVVCIVDEINMYVHVDIYQIKDDLIKDLIYLIMVIIIIGWLIVQKV